MLELFETGDSLVADDGGPVEEMLVVVLCIARLVDGIPLSELIGLLGGTLDTGTALADRPTSTDAFSRPLLMGDESILVDSFVCRIRKKNILDSF